VHISVTVICGLNSLNILHSKEKSYILHFLFPFALFTNALIQSLTTLSSFLKWTSVCIMNSFTGLDWCVINNCPWDFLSAVRQVNCPPAQSPSRQSKGHFSNSFSLISKTWGQKGQLLATIREVTENFVFISILFEWYPQTLIDCCKAESNAMIENQIY